ncbi:MAG: hypothetical protein JWO32_865 [Bacteroidetes bacterium]|nr:hypothetical protein [Bacteroidota bacterium]
MLKFLKENKLIVVAYLVLLGCIVSGYSLFEDSKFYLVFYSDSLGPYYVYKDIFVNHGDIKGWSFAAAPALFPDFTLYFLIIFIFKSTVFTTSFIYSLVQVMVICLLMSYIFIKVVQPPLKKYVWLIPVFFSMFYLESFYFSHDFLFAFFLTQPSYHSGAFVNTLILLAVYLGPLKNIFKYIWMFILSFIFGFSDILFFVMFCFPFIITMLLTAKRERLKSHLMFISSVITGSVGAILLFKVVKESKVFNFADPHKIYAFENIKPSFDMFIDQMAIYITTPGFRSFTIIFTVLSMIVLLIICIRKAGKMPYPLLFMLVYFVVFCLSVFPAPILNGNYTGWDTLRYNVHPFYLSGIIFTIAFAFVLEKYKVFTFTRFIAPVLLILFGFLFAVKFSSAGLTNFFSYYPADVKLIDSVCVKHNLKRGIAEYWTAKRASLLSHNHIQVLSAFPGGNICESGANINWFHEGDFDFVISDSFLPEAMKKKFVIKDTIKTEQYEFLIVEKFYYPKGEYFPKLTQK